MVSEENRTGLYVAVPVYFCMLGVATYWAYIRMEKMSAGGVSDKLAAHYLGGRDFGPLLTAGTLFASLFQDTLSWACKFFCVYLDDNLEKPSKIGKTKLTHPSCILSTMAHQS